VPDVAQNLATIEQQLAYLQADAAPTEQHVVVLPECCLYFGGQERAQLTLAQADHAERRLQHQLADLASRYQVYLVAGSMPQYVPEYDKFTNTSCLFSPSGALLQAYDKIHLFDVDVDDNEKCYRESRLTQAGRKLCVSQLPFANLGMAICYDLRFPELFRQLTAQGATIISLPAAFTQVTGQAHWQALLQARAIENQVYIVAAGQQGIHANGRETWGHSMIIDPWGNIVNAIDTGVGAISSPYLADLVTQVRTNIPVASHNQFSVQFNPSGQ
jgi:deaminated glutathione amidase